MSNIPFPYKMMFVWFSRNTTGNTFRCTRVHPWVLVELVLFYLWFSEYCLVDSCMSFWPFRLTIVFSVINSSYGFWLPSRFSNSKQRIHYFLFFCVQIMGKTRVIFIELCISALKTKYSCKTYNFSIKEGNVNIFFCWKLRPTPITQHNQDFLVGLCSLTS